MEFTLQVTLAFPEGRAESPADIKSEIHAAIVAWAQCCAYIPVVTVSDDHSEVAIAELTRVIGECLAMIESLRRRVWAVSPDKGNLKGLADKCYSILRKHSPPEEPK